MYRASSRIYVPKVEYDKSKPHAIIEWTEKQLTEEMAKEIVEVALSMTGDDYGWRNIWEIFKCYAPGFRLVKKPKEDVNRAKAYVCSTLVAYSFRKIYGDPCPNLSDTRTAPSDIAQSAMFHYLFTIGI